MYQLISLCKVPCGWLYNLFNSPWQSEGAAFIIVLLLFLGAVPDPSPLSLWTTVQLIAIREQASIPYFKKVDQNLSPPPPPPPQEGKKQVSAKYTNSVK